MPAGFRTLPGVVGVVTGGVVPGGVITTGVVFVGGTTTTGGRVVGGVVAGGVVAGGSTITGVPVVGGRTTTGVGVIGRPVAGGVVGVGVVGVPTGRTTVPDCPGNVRTGNGVVLGPGAAAGGREATGCAGVRVTGTPGCVYTGPAALGDDAPV